MDRKLTLGLLTPAWPGFETPNGIAASVYQLASGLKAIGHTPIIITYKLDASLPDGIAVTIVKQSSWSLVQKIAANLGRRADVTADATGDAIADAVEAADTTHGLDAVLMEETHGWAHRVARRGRVPVFVVLHGPWFLHAAIKDNGSALHRGRAARELRGYAGAVGILAPSQNVLEALENTVLLGNKPRTCIPNALISGSAAPPPSETGPVLFVGRFDNVKGGDTVLEAFARVHARRPDARLTFVGPHPGVRQADGSFLSFETALNRLPPTTRDAIDVPGQLSAPEVAALRRSHPIALIASRYEVLGYTVLEAMAAVQAIVSTEVGGPAEILACEKTALMVPPDDPGAMAEAILRLMGDQVLARRLGEAAAAELRHRFAPETIARQTADFVAACLEDPL